jgi:hypothetical protein
MWSKKFIFLMLFLLLALEQQASARTWRPNGQPVIKGEFQDVVGTNVTIRTEDGTKTVAYADLSTTDKAVVKTKLQSAGRETEAIQLDRGGAGTADSRPLPENTPPESGEDDEFMRTWTDILDNSIVAEFVGVEGPNALLRSGGTVQPYPIKAFSTADQIWIEEHRESVKIVTPDRPSAGDASPFPPRNPVFPAGPPSTKPSDDEDQGSAASPGNHQGLRPPTLLPPPLPPSIHFQPPPGFSRVQSPGQTEGEWILRCDNCSAEFPIDGEIKEGDECPKCSNSGSSWTFSPRSFRIGRGLIKGIIGLTVLVGSGIAWLVRKAINP